MIIEKKDYKYAVDVLKKDGIIAYPTDTVYGLAIRYNSNKALENLINRKKRPKEKSFPIMVSNLKMLKKVAIVNERSEEIINRLMPGALTVVLNKNDETGTIAIRMAHEETLKKIIEELNEPIYLTSANLSNYPTCNSPDEIVMYNLADVIVNGETKEGIASTIVDLTGDDIKILRQGPISLDDILNKENKNG
ncbi:MAG: threonylcarbamoyl-AMP synthase [Erysipelotrichaceae bacterium]|nr:threonylcarbamoyl-AMP synthase [Erysipelotrichaceae bacterium]